jgi:hypothetical protein
MVRGYSEGDARALLVGLGGLVPLGSSVKQDRFWCDCCDNGFGFLREGTAFVSRFHPACSSIRWIDVAWTSGVSLRMRGGDD